jgi:hypothetical protein
MPDVPSWRYLFWPYHRQAQLHFSHRWADTPRFVTTPAGPMISDNNQTTLLAPTWYDHKQPGIKTQGSAYAWGQKPAVVVQTALPQKKCLMAWTSSPWSRLEAWHIPSHPWRCCKPRTCVSQQEGIFSSRSLWATEIWAAATVWPGLWILEQIIL